MEHDTVWNEDTDITLLCRVCANPNEYLIPIYQDEGLEHDLTNKISKHLPIQVSEVDKLPHSLCYQCASTLIAWHDLVVGCVEADKKLRSLVGVELKGFERKVFADTNEETSENLKLAQTINKQINAVESTQVPKFTRTDKSKDVMQQIQEMSDVENEEIIEEEDTKFEPEVIQEILLDPRYLESFSAYHQTQVALRMHLRISHGPVFCILCGNLENNHAVLVKHLASEHLRCDHCKACFTSKDQLSVHLTIHGRKNSRSVAGKRCLGKDSISQSNELVAKGKDCKKRKSVKLNYREVPKENFTTSVTRKKHFQCNFCSTVFLRRLDMKKHIVKCGANRNFENAKENSCNALRGRTSLCDIILNEKAIESSKEKTHSDTEDDLDLVGLSDDSVNSEDISRHLDVKTKATTEPDDSACLSEKQNKVSFEQSLQKDGLDKPFSCSLCQNAYSRSSDLQRHICRKHGGEKFVGRCVDSIDDMDIEIVNQAKLDFNGTIVYQCDVCEKNMLTKRGYVRHIRTHTGERPFHCHVCGKQYRSNPDLNRHLKSVHEKVKNYPCDICGRCFANKGTRNDHRRTHTGEKPFMCHICGKAFPTPNSIYVHRRIHTDHFPHHCPHCDKKFRRRQQLTHHIRTHTGEKPHACDVCGKCFGIKDEVNRHKLTHSNVKPHICAICGLCFGQKRYLNNHTKTHHSRL